MKSKILTSLIIVLSLLSYTYGQEEDQCYTTSSVPCENESFTHNPACTSNPGGGVYTSQGNDVDQCVGAPSFGDPNNCTNEAQTWCGYYAWIETCAGAIIDYTSAGSYVTPTEDSGPCW